jgi:UDP-glucose 4-epimerase
MKKILVTGGAGFIGSHTCVELLNSGFEVVVIDNLSNSNKESLERVKKITAKELIFHNLDLLNTQALENLFSEYKFHAVIHFAGSKSVAESVKYPLLYFYNNVIATKSLCEVMANHNVKKLVFSSSATVYGDPNYNPIPENALLAPNNPYGRSKLMVEEYLMNLFKDDNDWKVIILRYFNPIGAHNSGFIGEDPNGIPNNLMPYICQVAVGKIKKLSIFGNDYQTKDGTGVRDYIHVVDLAKGHVAALAQIFQSEIKFKEALKLNLGTGKGFSVLEILNIFEKETGCNIPYKIVDRRPGDIAECFADASAAKAIMQWETKLNINMMCKDSWNWQKQFPYGY